MNLVLSDLKDIYDIFFVDYTKIVNNVRFTLSLDYMGKVFFRSPTSYRE